jgi:Tol biopolymer transport system component
VAQGAPAAFFSYCRDDSEFALRLAEDLKTAGANVWMDQLDIEPGMPWDRAIESAVTNCPSMLVILSPTSVNSDNVRDEISFALSKKKRVIPVLYRECDVPFRLARLQHIDFRADYAGGLKALLRTLGVERQAVAAGGVAVSAVPKESQPEVSDVGERKHTDEQARLEDGRRKAAEQTRLEEERKAAEQARLEEERKQAVEHGTPAPSAMPKQHDREAREKKRSGGAISSETVSRPSGATARATKRLAPSPPGQAGIPRLGSGRELLTLRGHNAFVTSVTWSPDGRLLATASRDQTAKVWDIAAGKELLTLTGATVYLVVWSPDGRRLATSSEVWDARSGRKLLTLRGHSGPVHCISWSPNGRRLATSSEDRTTKLWDADTGEELLTLTGETVYLVAWSPDGKRLATGTEGKVWDADTGKELLTIVPDEVLFSPAWSPNGMRLAAATFDGPAKVWNAETGKELLTLGGHHGPALSVAWSPDGRWLATGNEDNTASLWNAEGGDELLTLGGHNAPVLSVAWSPNGKQLATGSEDNTVKVWRVGK